MQTYLCSCTGVLPKFGFDTLMSRGLTLCERTVVRGVGPGPLWDIGYGARRAGPDIDIRPLRLVFFTVDGMGIPEVGPRMCPYGSAGACIVERRRKSDCMAY